MSRFFTVDARTILSLGRESIKEATTALVELVKNSYDADAERVVIEIATKVEPSYIRISDNGTGMSSNDVEQKWLRIGYSEKKETANRYSGKGRRRTGEKGVGRISADRLGKQLDLITYKGKELFGLRINWSDFEGKGKQLDRVPIEDITDPDITLPKMLDNSVSKSGTQLKIIDLRDTWDKNNIEELRRELSLLLSPFKKVKDFEISTLSDVDDAENGKVASDINEQAVVSLDAKYRSNASSLKYNLKTIDQKKGKNSEIKLAQLLNIRAAETDEVPKLSCGDVDVKLLFYIKGKSVFGDISLNRKAVSSFVDANAGIKIYRDDVWVKPYGEMNKEEWDWLNLGRRYGMNPAGAGRKSFRIRPQQLVGAVFISRDQNPTLADSSGREGLIKGAGYEDLKKLTEACVQLIETGYHDRFIQDKGEDSKTASSDMKLVAKDTSAVLKEMQKIAPMIAQSALDQKSKESFEASLDKVKEIHDTVKDVSKTVLDFEREQVLFRGLATVGISMSVFGHEIQSAITHLLNISYRVRDYLNATPPKNDKAIEKIERLVELSDSVSGWGTYALNRMQRSKRSRRMQNISNLASKVINDISPPFKAAQIDLQLHLRSLEGKVFSMDLEAILINLLTNAYYACLQKARNRKIRVELRTTRISSDKAIEIIVADSGPGVSSQFRDRIWEPLFTTKSEGQGTGLGLAIIDSVVRESNGTRHIDTDNELKGARFAICLPIE